LPLFFREISNNKILMVSVFSWFVAQILKIIINYKRSEEIDFKLIMSSGGMPSSHSSIVTSMATCTGYTNGFDSSIFAVACVISMIVMYDATGVRRAAGEQAAILNVMIYKLGDPDLPIDTKLKELLGHTPVQVAAGALLGILIAVIFQNLI
jgi:uncharacterized protein